MNIQARLGSSRVFTVLTIAAALAGCGGSGSGSQANGTTANTSPGTTVGSTAGSSFGAGAGNTSSSSGAATSGTSGSSSSSGAGPTANADSVTLSWLAPTENTDGSALVNLTGYDIHYGTSAGAMTQKIQINTVGMLTYVVSNLASGTWFFEVTATNSAGVDSGPSSTVSATI